MNTRATPMIDDAERREQRWRVAVIALVLIILGGVSVSYVHKVSGGQGAFTRWERPVQKIVHGENIYAREHLGEDGEPAFPTTPIVAVLLYPLYQMPTVAGAIVFAAIKFAMAAVAVWWAILLATPLSVPRYGASPCRAHGSVTTADHGAGAAPQPPHGTPLSRRTVARRGSPPAWAIAVVILLAARPIISDIQHGNINILILFLMMAGLWLYARERPIAGGAIIGAAIVVKVTPGLFVLYFLWKRDWRALIGCALGLALAAALPSLILGIETNYQMHRSWFDAMILPFLTSSGTQWTVHINQSLPGVVLRLLTESRGVQVGESQETIPINIVSLNPEVASWIVRGLLLATLLWLGYVCRTRAGSRSDWRLVCEWGLILIGMLIMSERTWKHHYVTIVLPLACVVMHLALHDPSRAMRRYLIGTLIAFFALTMLTSGEIIGWIYEGVAHKFVEGIGSFFLAGLLLFAALSVTLIRADGHDLERRISEIPR